MAVLLQWQKATLELEGSHTKPQITLIFNTAEIKLFLQRYLSLLGERHYIRKLIYVS